MEVSGLKVKIMISVLCLMLAGCQNVTPDVKYKDTETEQDFRIYLDWDYNGRV